MELVRASSRKESGKGWGSGNANIVKTSSQLNLAIDPEDDELLASISAPWTRSGTSLIGNTLSCVAVHNGHRGWRTRLRVRTAKLLQSSQFEWITGLAIIANSVMIGIDQSIRLQGHTSPFLDIGEDAFLTVFTLELLGRVFAFGLGCFKSAWIVFDLVLVSVSIAVGWVLKGVLSKYEDQLAILMVLRTIRLLRLGRTLRLLIHFKELWMLVRGLLASVYTIIYTLIILLVIIYMFASVGVELITNHPLADPESGDEVFAGIVHENFRNLQESMLTLIQFATLDSVAAIYMPLIKSAPYLIIYFASLIVVVGIVLMNLITAVVVNSALEQAMQDKEMVALDLKKRKAKAIRELNALFQRLDTDDSGSISRGEFAQIMGEDRETLSQLISIQDLGETFDALDVNDQGSVSIDEFCEVLWTASCNPGSIAMKRTEKKLDVLRGMMEEFVRHIGNEPSLQMSREVRDLPAQSPDKCPAVDESVPGMGSHPTLVPGVEASPLEPPALRRRTQEMARDAESVHQEVSFIKAESAWRALQFSCESTDEHPPGQAKRPGNVRKVNTCTPVAARPLDSLNRFKAPDSSWQAIDVPSPLWVTCVKQSLIRELHATKQRLLHEVDRACRGMHADACEAPTPECSDAALADDGVPEDLHSYITAGGAKAATKATRFITASGHGSAGQCTGL